MNISKLTILIFIISQVLCSSVFAQTKSQTSSPFMPSKWSKSVDLIEAKLGSTEWTAERISSTLAVLNDLQKNAKKCVQDTQAELDKINLALVQSSVTNPKQIERLEAASLNEKEIELNDLHAECRLFILRSQDVITEVEKLQQHIIASQIFSKGPSIVANMLAAPSLTTLIKETDSSVLSQNLGLPYFTKLNFFLMGFLGLLSLYLGYSLARFSRRKLSEAKKDFFFHTILAVLSRYAYPLVFSLLFSIYFTLFSWPNIFIFPGWASTLIFVYLALMALFQFIFYPPENSRALISLPGAIPRALNLRIFYLLTLILSYYICFALIQGQNYTVNILELGASLYITLLSISMMSILWLVMKFPLMQGLNRYIHIFLDLFFAAVLLTVLIAEWLGYHYFSIFLIRNIVISFSLACVAFGLHLIVSTLMHWLMNNHDLRYHLGVRFHRSITELSLLHAVLQVSIWGGLMVILLKVWVLSESYYNQLVSALRDGFTFFGFTLVPARILLAMLVFVFLSLGNRLLHVYLSRHSPYYIEEGGQVATATIVSYAGFAALFIISLVIAGVNFTGLAIIAGALSVGIGFGLQNIANNFISGLILLLDNPIRPGDRIQVGDIEGVVKRIRLRATHIYTMRHADVFIPNSELISKSVTNFVFHDKIWSIVCSVGVEYGCDIKKVRDILMQVALKHPDVVQDEGKKPQIYFKKFMDSSLLFELWCSIRDVNRKFSIESDLNAAIYEALKENHINIPFPQQDLHIKDWPKGPPE